jgi:hypothetical protein
MNILKQIIQKLHEKVLDEKKKHQKTKKILLQSIKILQNKWKVNLKFLGNLSLLKLD